MWNCTDNQDVGSEAAIHDKHPFFLVSICAPKCLLIPYHKAGVKSRKSVRRERGFPASVWWDVWRFADLRQELTRLCRTILTRANSYFAPDLWGRGPTWHIAPLIQNRTATNSANHFPKGFGGVGPDVCRSCLHDDAV